MYLQVHINLNLEEEPIISVKPSNLMHIKDLPGASGVFSKYSTIFLKYRVIARALCIM